MDMFENFETYEKKGRFYSPRISLSGSGWISFNSTAYEELSLSKYKYCVFLYNASTKEIGVKFTNIECSGSYELKPRENSEGKKSVYILIKGFALKYKIKVESKFLKFDIKNKAEKEGELWIILSPKYETSIKTENLGTQPEEEPAL